MDVNVFSSLFRYGHGVDENYLTEALIFLVKLLLQRLPRAGLELTNLLSGKGQGAFSDPSSLTFSTQVTVDEARPDIEIRHALDTLVFVEVKHDSGLGRTSLSATRPSRSGPPHLPGVDEDGRLAVFDLKRRTLTRGAVAQVIDYTSDRKLGHWECVAW
jgi:hypothetical protein